MSGEPTIIDPLPTEPVETNPLYTSLPEQEHSNIPNAPISKKKLLQNPKIIVSMILCLLALGIFGSVAFAYDLLPIKNAPLETKMGMFIMSFSFMPKTPLYVLESAVNAQTKITKLAFNASLAADTSSAVTPLLNTTHYDGEMLGSVDYSDSTNPTATLSTQIIKDLYLDVIVKNQIVYFRVDSIPASLQLLFPNFSTLKAKWFFLNSQTLPTDARNSLNSDLKNQNKLQQQTIQNDLNTLNNPTILKSLSMTQETLTDVVAHQVYHLHFTPTSSVLDSLNADVTTQAANSSSKISDYLKNVTFDMWVDKSDYTIYKIQSNLTINPSKTGLQNNTLTTLNPLDQDILISFVLKFSNFNLPVTVNTPVGAEDFYKTILKGY